MKHLTLLLSFICLLLLAVAAPATSQGNTPASVTAVIAKYKSDACFTQLDKLDRPTSSKLVPLVCPGTDCGAKFADVIATYANSRDNAWGLAAHVLAFHRDLACMPAANVTAAPPATATVLPPGATFNGTQVESSRVVKPATCIEDIDNQMGNPPRGVFDVLTSWTSMSLAGDYLRAAARDANHVRRSAPRAEVCDQSKCTHKYMNQWHLWLTGVADEYLAAIRGDQRAAMGMMDGAKEAASLFAIEVVARCEEGNKPWERTIGGLGVGKLEAGAGVPKKVEAAPANAAGAVGPSMVAMAVLVASMMAMA